MSTGKCAVCYKAASQECATCHAVNYCGKDHQKQDWSKHRNVCYPYKVKTSPERGRYVVALRDIKEGEIIVKEEPLALGPDYVTPVRSCCLGCYRITVTSAECPRCKWPLCRATCPGLKDPAYHGAECSVLSKIQSSTFLRFPEIILPLRCLLLQKHNPKKGEVLQKMAAMAVKLSTSTKSLECKTLLEESILKPLQKTAPTMIPNTSAEIVNQVFALLDAYGLEVKLPYTGNLVGIGAVSSIMEHSCLPNTRRVFDIPPAGVEMMGVNPAQCQIVVRASKNIRKGEHITASFVRNLMCTYSRQQVLMRTRKVYCKCERCLDPRELGTDYGTLRCPNMLCAAWVLPLDTSDILSTGWRCQGCGVTYSALYLMLLFEQITEETEAVRMQEKQDIAKLEKLLTERLLSVLHPNHYFCVVLKRRMYSLYENQYGRPGVLGASRMSDTQLQQKAELCQEVLSVIGHPSFESTDGAVDGCLMQLSTTLAEIAKRKNASGEWSPARVKEALEESQQMIVRAMSIQSLQMYSPTGAMLPEWHDQMQRLSHSALSMMM